MLGRFRWARRFAPRTRAQAMVELALVLPMFLFLVMAALQLALVAVVWISLQGLTQNTTRWMAVSSIAPAPTSLSCAPSGTNALYPRPRWADGNDGKLYRNCILPPLLRQSNFDDSKWIWSPACANGTDCFATGVRTTNQMLTLTATYDWSNVLIMPTLSGGGLLGWNWPTTMTVSAAEVMQY